MPNSHKAIGATAQKNDNIPMLNRRSLCTLGLQRPARGVTLIELLVTLSIMAILTAVAMPSFNGMAKDFAVSGQANAMNADIRYARSEAMKRGRQVVLCASADPMAATSTCSGTDWRTGWLIFVDNDRNNAMDAGDILLRRQESWGSKSAGISASRSGTDLNAIALNADGRIPATAGANGTVVTFRSAGSNTEQMTKFLCISSNGRPKAVKEASACNS
jgi:type IV fimbrial biogenesis protein FimT